MNILHMLHTGAFFGGHSHTLLASSVKYNRYLNASQVFLDGLLLSYKRTTVSVVMRQNQTANKSILFIKRGQQVLF